MTFAIPESAGAARAHAPSVHLTQFPLPRTELLQRVLSGAGMLIHSAANDMAFDGRGRDYSMLRGPDVHAMAAKSLRHAQSFVGSAARSLALPSGLGFMEHMCFEASVRLSGAELVAVFSLAENPSRKGPARELAERFYLVGIFAPESSINLLPILAPEWVEAAKIAALNAALHSKPRPAFSA